MKEFISWNVVDECVTDIAEHLIRTGIEFAGVYGIPRGGVILAVMLSHKLDIPFIMDVKEGPYHAVRDDYIIIDDKRIAFNLNSKMDYDLLSTA